jgi:hypothetical protein
MVVLMAVRPMTFMTARKVYGGWIRSKRVGPEPLTQRLRTLKLQSLTQVENLQTLHQIVLALEAVGREWAVKQ